MMYKELQVVDNLKEMDNLNNSIATSCLFFEWDLWKINIEANDVVSFNHHNINHHSILYALWYTHFGIVLKGPGLRTPQDGLGPQSWSFQFVGERLEKTIVLGLVYD